jgi:hypothetical protein
MLCAVGAGALWFAVTAAMHGAELRSQLWADQVVNRIVPSPWTPLLHFPEAVFLTGLTLMPWIYPALRAAVTDRGRLSAALTRHMDASPGSRSAATLLVGWIALYLICAALVERTSIRYVLPATVPLAALLGLMLTTAAARPGKRFYAGCTVSLAGVTAVACALAIVLGSALPDAKPALVGGCVLLALATTLLLGRRRVLPRAVVLATVTLLLLPALWSVLRPFGAPDDGEAIVRTLATVEIPERKVSMIAHPKYAARVRVAGGGSVEVRTLQHEDIGDALPRGVLVLDESAADLVSMADYQLATARGRAAHVRVSDLVGAIARGDLERVIDDQRRRYVIAVPR